MATVSFVGDRLGPPVEDLDFDGIQRARARVAAAQPGRRPRHRRRRPVGRHHLRHRAGPRRPRDPAADLPPAGAARRAHRRAGRHVVPRRRLGARQRRRLRPDVHLHRRRGRLRRRVGRLPDGARAPGAGGRRRTASTPRPGSASTATCCAPTPRGWPWPATRPGGNLAAVVAQVLRDHGDTRLRHQALIYPATDLTMSSPSVREHPNAADPHQAVDGRLPRPLRAGRPRPARPAALAALRPARRPAAGPGADRRPRPDPRRRHPVRRRAAGGRRAGAPHELPQGAARLRVHAGRGARGGAPAAVGAGQRAHRRTRRPTTADRLRTCARSSCSPGRPTPPSPTGSATSWG